MVTLDKIRIDMKEFLAVDKNLHMVDVNADTIDEALADAAVQLNTKASNLQYEVIEKGNDGFLGLGKKPWKIKIYQDPTTISKERKLASDGLFISDDIVDEELIKDQDGLFYVRHFGSDIMLKIVLPVGNGLPIDSKDVMDEIKRPDTLEYDESLIKKYVKQGTSNDYLCVGKYKHVAAGDVSIVVDITKDELKASILVAQPTMSGSEASNTQIRRLLMQQGVIEQCIDDKKINEFVDNPVYNVPYEVASAILPIDGKDAYLSYNMFIDLINTNTDNLLVLVNEIVDLSNIQSGDEIRHVEYDLADDFNKVMADLSRQCVSPEVQFIQDNPYQKCILMGDKLKVNMLLTHLTKNAIRFTKSGHVKVGYSCVDNMLTITVEDTGIGR